MRNQNQAPPIPPSPAESKSSKVSNKDLVHMAFRILPAYFGLCVGYLVMTWNEDSERGLWRILAVLTGMIALVSCVAFWLAGQRAYADWMLTANDAQQMDATKHWLKTQRAARIFVVLGFVLGLGLGYLGVHEVIMAFE